MEQNIIFDGIEYSLNDTLGKLSRIIKDDDGIETKLVSEYMPNILSTPDTFIYALSEDKLYSLDLPNSNKSLNGLSIEEYVEKGRPAIFYKVSKTSYK